MKEPIIGNKYIRRINNKYCLVYYCGKLASIENPEINDFYFTVDNNVINRINNGETIWDITNTLDWRLTTFSTKEVKNIKKYSNDKQLRSLEKYYSFYEWLSPFITWLYNYRRLFHGTTESWNNSIFYRRLFYINSFLGLRFFMFLVFSLLRLILKAVLVPLFFILNIIYIPFIHFYQYMGLKNEKKRLSKRLKIEFLFEGNKAKVQTQLNEIDDKINNKQEKYYNTANSLLTLVFAILAIIMSIYTFSKDDEISSMDNKITSLNTQLLNEKNLQLQNELKYTTIIDEKQNEINQLKTKLFVLLNKEQKDE